jgi:type I restriction-modification system DNA methylase subunit
MHSHQSVIRPASGPPLPLQMNKPKATKPNGRNGDTQANIGYEEKLWKAADTFRGAMDAAEYKHVVLGLIFLKYVSDSYEERRQWLLRETADPKSEYFVKKETQRGYPWLAGPEHPQGGKRTRRSLKTRNLNSHANRHLSNGCEREGFDHDVLQGLMEILAERVPEWEEGLRRTAKRGS